MPLVFRDDFCYHTYTKMCIEVSALNRILQYIQDKYKPLGVIVYGSYADGTNDANSDFDALVISTDGEQCHDNSFVGEVQLDVFVYPASYFDGEYACEDFVQIVDGRIIADVQGLGNALQTHVRNYVRNRPHKSQAEMQASIDWCVKMLERVKRYDAEGLFRWHWVLVDSLEIFCDVMEYPYFGPKKSLKWMEKQHPVAFGCYEQALREFNKESLEAWITYLQTLLA